VTDKLLTLSPSRINQFERCQLQYYFREIEGKKTPPGIALVIGGSVDASANVDLQAKLDTGDLLPLDAVQTAARDHLENEWAGGVQNDGEDSEDKGEVIDLTVRLATLHHEAVAPLRKPLAVQLSFGVQVDETTKLTGHIDVLEADAVCDCKTIGKKPSKIKGDHLIQTQLYAVGVAVNGGALPSKVKLDYLVKNKTVKTELLEAPVTPESAQGALDRLSVTARVIQTAIKTGDFLPAPADSWVCQAAFCGYFSHCEFGAKARIQG
jgi:CRISPR/Cas system-associated exonuclease Cas4 (RecB family)